MTCGYHCVCCCCEHCAAAGLQANVTSAEQQASSLEAALQKSSQVTLSMTEKVAQTLAASSAQAEALKVSCKLACRGFHECPGRLAFIADTLQPLLCQRKDGLHTGCSAPSASAP